MFNPKKIVSKPTNHGPVCCFRCPRCSDEVYFDLVSEEIAVKFLFMKIGVADGAWYLQCRTCQMEIVLNDHDSGEAMAMARYVRNLSPEELQEATLESLLKKFPIEGLKTLLKSNENWVCPNCGSDVPKTMTSCWKCQQ